MKISVDRLKRAKEEGFEQIAEHQNGKYYQVSNIDVVIARGGHLILAKYLLYNGTHSHDIDWSKTIKLDDIRNDAWFNSFLNKHKMDIL
jgi:hypothetical protein